jgi:hypothetical protein
VGASSDTLAAASADEAPGTTATYGTMSVAKFPISAQVVLQPGISSLSPVGGPPGGGTTMTITGHDFTGATAVSFGGVPEASFTVNSDASITAVPRLELWARSM